ncbi:DUF4178 domain-containing protein [Flavobacterium limnosediminis]|nr:DUF4178 domain-containing protein [Flavobacterium limnosediminis]
MKVPCYHCDVTTDVEVNFDVKTFVCPNCQNLYLMADDGLRSQKGFSHRRPLAGLNVGQKGRLRGEDCTVTGILTKKAYGSYYWDEYILESKKGDFIYLSEASGHWILLKEVEDSYDVKNHPRFLTHNEIRMNLYDYTDTEIVAAQGYFDFVIPVKKVHMVEYIQPPYIISIETLGDQEATFFGEHISVKEIKKGFSMPKTPIKTGVGMVQPFLINVRNLAIIMCSAAVLILSSHLFIYSDKTEQVVLSESLTFDQHKDKSFVSPSFVLKGGSAPLTISTRSDVDNSWANLQVALVNEKTNEEVYANKDIEYYHGYTDGENWTEGDTSEEFNICGVNEGKYHIVVTPMKAPEDITNNFIKVNAVWNQPSMWNVWMPILFMGILTVGLYYLSIYFEQKRWAESSYSPYDN